MNGKEGITEFVRVRYNLPLQKDAELFEKDTEVLKKDTELFEKHQGLFASFSTGCLFLNVHVGIGLHVYTYRGSVVILGGLTFVNFPLCIHLC